MSNYSDKLRRERRDELALRVSKIDKLKSDKKEEMASKIEALLNMI